MNEHTKELVSISAAVAGHCRPCFAHHYKRAVEIGLRDEDIREAALIGREIRASGDRQIDRFVEGKIENQNTGAETR